MGLGSQHPWAQGCAEFATLYVDDPRQGFCRAGAIPRCVAISPIMSNRRSGGLHHRLAHGIRAADPLMGATLIYPPGFAPRTFGA
jgi:hypothetical protein